MTYDFSKTWQAKRIMVSAITSGIVYGIIFDF